MVKTPGSKDLKPRKRKLRPAKTTKEVVVKTETDKAVEIASELFIQNLSGDMKKLYESYATNKMTPLEDMKDLSNTMKARYKIALQTEMANFASSVNQSKKELKQLLKDGKIDDKKVSKARLRKRISRLEVEVAKGYRVSSTVTTLGEALKNLLVEIQRIESGKDDRNVNIFQILNGQVHNKQVVELEEDLFPAGEPIDVTPIGTDYSEEEDAKEPE